MRNSIPSGFQVCAFFSLVLLVTVASVGCGGSDNSTNNQSIELTTRAVTNSARINNPYFRNASDRYYFSRSEAEHKQFTDTVKSTNYHDSAVLQLQADQIDWSKEQVIGYASTEPGFNPSFSIDHVYYYPAKKHLVIEYNQQLVNPEGGIGLVDAADGKVTKFCHGTATGAWLVAKAYTIPKQDIETAEWKLIPMTEERRQEIADYCAPLEPEGDSRAALSVRE